MVALKEHDAAALVARGEEVACHVEGEAGAGLCRMLLIARMDEHCRGHQTNLRRGAS
jgi:hypothetical protein